MRLDKSVDGKEEREKRGKMGMAFLSSLLLGLFVELILPGRSSIFSSLCPKWTFLSSISVGKVPSFQLFSSNGTHKMDESPRLSSGIKGGKEWV